MSKTDDELAKIFKYMQQEFKAVRSEVGEARAGIRSLQVSVDSYAKQVMELTQEHLMLSRKVDRMENWIQEIAQKTGVKLKF